MSEQRYYDDRGEPILAIMDRAFMRDGRWQPALVARMIARLQRERDVLLVGFNAAQSHAASVIADKDNALREAVELLRDAYQPVRLAADMASAISGGVVAGTCKATMASIAAFLARFPEEGK